MKPILITTDKRGVFFGYADEGAFDALPESITLKDARNCIYWSKETRGFLGLAESGPAEGSRVGPKVESLTLWGITSVADVSAAAVERWESGPWAE